MVGAPSTSMLVPLERRQFVDPAAIAVAPGANEPCRVRRARVATQKLLPVKATVDVPLALAIVGLGLLVVIAPSSVPALTAARI